MSDVDTTTEGLWNDGLSDDIRNHRKIRTHKSLESLAAAHIELNDTLDQTRKRVPARGSVIVPGPDASDTQKREYRRKMEIPETGDDYDLGETTRINPKRPEDLPQSMHPDVEKALRATFQEAGLNQRQGQAVVSAYMDSIHLNAQVTQQELEKKTAAAERELSEEFGEKLPAQKAKLGVFRQMATMGANGEADTALDQELDSLYEDAAKAGLSARLQRVLFRALDHVGADRFARGAPPTLAGDSRNQVTGAQPTTVPWRPGEAMDMRQKDPFPNMADHRDVLPGEQTG